MNVADALVMMLWRNALAAVPLALLVIIFCRCVPCRPSTRHALWLLVLGSLLLPPVIPQNWREKAVAGLSDRVALLSNSTANVARHAWVHASRLAVITYAQFREKELPQTVEAAPLAKPDTVLATKNSSLQPVPCASTPAPPVCADSSVSSEDDANRPLRLAAVPMTSMPQVSEIGPVPRQPASIVRADNQIAPSRSTPRSTAQGTAAFSMQTPVPPASVFQTQSPSRTMATPIVTPQPRNPVARSSGNPAQLIAAPVAPLVSNQPVLPRVHPPTKPAQTTAATPKPIDLPSKTPEASVNLKASVQPWFDSLATIRDAVVRIPPLPLAVWFGGVIVLLIIAIIRIWRFRAILARGVPASQDVLTMVSQVANQLNLRSAPATVMIDRRVPPMIWCGRPMRLILPAPLWDELDQIGRRAVIVHELAHLKRRDHWVCWLSAIVGLVYWWHPVVWWCRRRLREEADFCCDNWVTTLLPRARRAYAQALLAARSTMNETGSPMPAVGLGTSTPRAKKFARRLTMVMTNQTGPRMSRWGFAGVALLGAAAWLAAPLWACPPESSENTAEKVAIERAAASAMKRSAAVAPRAPRAMAAPSPFAATSPPTPPTAPRAVMIAPGQKMRSPDAEASTFERHMAGRAGSAAPGAIATWSGSGLDGRLDELESRLDQLTEQIERLLHDGATPAPRSGQGGGGGGDKQPAPYAGIITVEPRIADAYRRALTTYQGFGGSLGLVRERSASSDEIVDRTYTLPEGKLEALTGLMARSDVPILIERQDGAILVRATPAQHMVFEAFVAMIDPEGAHAGAAVVGADAYALGADARWRALAELEAMQPSQFKRLREVGQEVQLAQRLAMAVEQRARIDASRVEGKALREQAEHVRKHAEDMRRKAEELRRKAEEYRSKAGAMNDDDHRQQELEAQADAIEREADQIEMAAEQVEAQAEQLDAQAEAADDRASEVEEMLASAEEEVAEADAEMAELQAEVDVESAEATADEIVTSDAPAMPPGVEQPALPAPPAPHGNPM